MGQRRTDRLDQTSSPPRPPPAPRAAPLYRRIHDRITGSIADGRLAAGDRLPSARSLAAELGVARGSVDAAYALLAGEGVVVAAGRRGTVVAAGARPSAASPGGRDDTGRGLRCGARSAGAAVHRAAAADTRPAGTGPVPPHHTWSRLLSAHARGLAPATLRYPDARGDPELRTAVRAQLAVSRGVHCAAEQIFITGGFQSTLGLVARAAMQPGDPAWIEEPGFAITRRALAWAGARVVPVPVDAQGIDVAAGIARAPTAAICVVTPAHHFPYGMAMSIDRRRALLAWADGCGAWIVEDDYDGEFCQAPVLPALKSLDAADRVIYAGTFSKTLFPGLRLGYVVVPAPLVARCHDALRLLDGGRGQLEQAVCATFIAEGHFARHVARMRRAYASRRAAFARALADRFGADRVPDHGGSLQLLLRVGPHDDATL